MKKLVMIKGLPGSGKSTWACEFIKGKKDWIRVNNDSLQLMMFGEAFAEGRGAVLDKVRQQLIEYLMEQGFNIVVDNTNLAPKHEENYRTLVEVHNLSTHTNKYEFQIKDFTNVSLEECLKRNKMRASFVPDKVILDMHARFLAKPFQPLSQDNSLPKAIIVDIDGTVADLGDRDPYNQKYVMEDKPIEAIVEMVKRYKKDGYKIIYISGREEYSRKDTLAWFEHYKLPCDALYLNKTNERRSSTITKKEIFEANVKDKYYVEFVLEDRAKNVAAWRAMGLLCLQVAEGNF